MGTELERRIAKLETAAGVNIEYYSTLVIFEDDGASVEVARNWGPDYLRKRGNDESATQFERRVTAEARSLGPKVTVVTRQRYDEIVAKLQAEV